MSVSFSVIVVAVWRLSKYVSLCFSLSLCAVLWYSGFGGRVLISWYWSACVSFCQNFSWLSTLRFPDFTGGFISISVYSDRYVFVGLLITCFASWCSRPLMFIIASIMSVPASHVISLSFFPVYLVPGLLFARFLLVLGSPLSLTLLLVLLARRTVFYWLYYDFVVLYS